MRERIEQVRRDERGFTLVFVGLGFMAFFVTMALAVDVGMSMTARGQAQNAADAGALAGATAIAFNNFTDHSSAGPAVQSAINTATANQMMGAAPTVWPTDVTFPTDPVTGESNRVQVSVYRTAGHGGNPVSTIIASIFRVNSVDISATATAEASPANAVQCVKPFMIPDRWTEKVDDKGTADGPWDPDQNYTFDIVDKSKKPLANPDVYVSADQPGYTGYTQSDFGTELVLRAGTGTNAYPSSYYSWSMPGDTGGNDYRNNISGCNQTIIPISSSDPYYMTQEPGDMTGPTNQGVDDLLAADPDATFDTSCNCVKNSAFGTSPRITPLPLYNPYVNAAEKVNGRTAVFQLANVLGFFIERRSGNQVYGKIMALPGMADGDFGPAPGASFPKAIRLVK